MQHMLRDAVFGSIMQWLHGLIGLVFATIGWPGVIAIAAGCLLLLSASAKAITFLSSPRGMGFTAGIMAVSLVLTWLFWPKLASAKPRVVLASYEPNVRRTDRPQPKPKPVEQPPILASKLSPPPFVARQSMKTLPPELPAYAFDQPALTVAPPPLPPVVIPPAPGIVVVPPKHHTGQQAAHPSPPKATQHAANSPPPKATPPQGRPQGRGTTSRPLPPGWPTPAQTGNGRSQAAMQAQRNRAMAAEYARLERQYNMMMGGMMMQHYGGMGHMGGMHPGGMGHGGHLGSHGGHH